MWEETALLKSVWLVANREYREHLGTKSFWIGILFMPLILLTSTVGPAWLEGRTTVRRYAVIDRSGWLLDAVEKRALAADVSSLLNSALVQARTDPNGLANLPPTLREAAGKLSSLDGKDEERAKLVHSLALRAVGVTEAAGEPRGASLPESEAGEFRDAISAVAQWWSSLSDSEASELNPKSPRARFRRVATHVNDSSGLNNRVETGGLFAYFLLPEDPVADFSTSKYVSTNITDRSLPDWFRNLAGEEIRVQRLKQAGINPELGEWIRKPVQFNIRTTTGDGLDRPVGDQDLASQWLPTVISLVLWFAVFGVSQMLLTNTIEEKANRVLEILLSSISPLQLMAGKIVGIALTGFTVLASWLLSFLALAYLFAGPGVGAAKVSPMPIAGGPFYLTSFLLYFILGYLFYATLLVGIGSICNTLKEAQNLMIPVSLLLFTPLLTLLPVAKDPNGDLAMVLSFIPPFTPFVMMNRAAGPPAPWEYLASSILLVGSIVVLFWASGKVFRIGILMTSQRPSLWTVLGWLRAPVGQVAPKGDVGDDF